jgi:hypothetical protein
MGVRSDSTTLEERGGSSVEAHHVSAAALWKVLVDVQVAIHRIRTDFGAYGILADLWTSC